MAINHCGDPYYESDAPDSRNGMNPPAETAPTTSTDEPHTRENYDTTPSGMDTSLLSPDEREHGEKHRRFRRRLLGGVAFLMALTGAAIGGAYAKNNTASPESEPPRTPATAAASPSPSALSLPSPSPEVTRKNEAATIPNKLFSKEKTLDDIVSPGPIVGATYQEVAKKGCEAIEYSINKDPENIRNAMDYVQSTDSRTDNLISYGQQLKLVRDGGNPNNDPKYDLRKVAMAFECVPLDRLDKPGVDAITSDTPGFTVHIKLLTGQYRPYGDYVMMGNPKAIEATMFMSKVKDPWTGGGYKDGGYRIRYIRHMDGTNVEFPSNVTEQAR